MTEMAGADRDRDIAYYYPEPYWQIGEVDSVKTLLLFFDEIATLLPRYMRGRETLADPVLAGPLAERGLLRVLEPEVFVDQQMTEELSDAMVGLITGDAFRDLDQQVQYAELSRSRLGWDADVNLAGMVIDELEARGLARPSEDGVSVPLHPIVRTTVLVMLSQLARRTAQRSGLNFHPTASQVSPVQALMRTLARPLLPSAGHVIALDLEIVTVNLAAVPLDEILDFRADHGHSYRAYARDLRNMLIQLGTLPEDERQQLLADRQEALADQASDLRRQARQAWRLPFASFSLGAAGAAWGIAGQHDVLSGLLALGGGIAGALSHQSPTAAAYSYLFEAQRVFDNR